MKKIKKGAHILDAVWTSPTKTENGGSGVHPQVLASQVLNAVISRSRLDARDLDEVIMGCVSQVKEQGANIARNSVLASLLPPCVSAVSVNRSQGSGLQAVYFAAMSVCSGFQQLVIGGGVECMSLLGVGSDGGGQDGQNMTLRQRYPQLPPGMNADMIATLEGFSRRELDQYALRSHLNTKRSIDEGRFKNGEIFTNGRVIETARDIGHFSSLQATFSDLGGSPFGDAGETLDELALAHYPGISKIQHIHTSATSSFHADGAAALLIASSESVQNAGRKSRARIRAVASATDDPTLPGQLEEAATRVLSSAKMKASDIDLWEISETFASVPLKIIRALKIDMDRVNVNGGALALGDPIGATGAMLVGRALIELERSGKENALITLPVLGGQSMAAIIERV